MFQWLQYDSQFLLNLAANVNPSMHWSVSDPDLIATWLSADAIKIKQPCFTCGSPDHFATNCPFKATVQSRCGCLPHLLSEVCSQTTPCIRAHTPLKYPCKAIRRHTGDNRTNRHPITIALLQFIKKELRHIDKIT